MKPRIDTARLRHDGHTTGARTACPQEIAPTADERPRPRGGPRLAQPQQLRIAKDAGTCLSRPAARTRCGSGEPRSGKNSATSRATFPRQSFRKEME
jgi:hypothetical protein